MCHHPVDRTVVEENLALEAQIVLIGVDGTLPVLHLLADLAEGKLSLMELEGYIDRLAFACGSRTEVPFRQFEFTLQIEVVSFVVHAGVLGTEHRQRGQKLPRLHQSSEVNRRHSSSLKFLRIPSRVGDRLTGICRCSTIKAR